jgi:hypothetical protein
MPGEQSDMIRSKQHPIKDGPSFGNPPHRASAWAIQKRADHERGFRLAEVVFAHLAVIKPLAGDMQHRGLTELPVRVAEDRRLCQRGLVEEFNVYRWAGGMPMDAARILQQARILRQMGARDARTTTGGQA